MSRRRPKSNHTEHLVARALDAKSAHDDFIDDLKPILKQAMKERWPRAKLLAHPVVQNLMFVRAVSIAVTEPDAGKALAAIRELTDRVEGKATEKKDITHRMGGAQDPQLDARIKTLLTGEAEDDDAPADTH